jgi:hypothetical protein
MGIEAELLKGIVGSTIAEHALDEFAHELAEEIRDLTPEFDDHPPKRGEPPHGQPGDAKAAIEVKPMGPGKRRIESRDYKAIWIELGSRHMPEFAPFGKVAALHGGTGPIIDEGINEAQHHLRHTLERLAKLGAEGASAESIAQQRLAVNQARQARSSAFKAARGGRRRGR